MCLLFVLMLSLIFETVSTNLLQIKCDFSLHMNGCEDTDGSVCDRTLNQCVCRADHTVRLSNGVCLRPKMIDEECITSAQCLVKNSACFASDPALKHWKCQCNPEFWLNQSHNESLSCDQRHAFGDKCLHSNQCSEQLLCSTTDQICVCDQDFQFDPIVRKCIHKNSTTCDEKQEWSQQLRKCVPKVHYSHRGSSGGGSGARAGVGGRSSGSKGWFGNSSGHRIKCYANIYFYLFAIFVILILNNKSQPFANQI